MPVVESSECTPCMPPRANMPPTKQAKWSILCTSRLPFISATYVRPCQVTFTNFNKTGTSKVGAISKAQKAQNFFLKIGIFEFFSFGKCRIVPKNVKGGTLWALLTYILLQNIKKLERGTLLRH